VTDQISDSGERASHWESVYGRNQADTVSWYQTEPVVSLELVDLLGISAEAGVIDVGGGASVLVDALLLRGFTDLTVLDISEAALRASQERVGADAPVDWIAHDLLTWEPARRYDLWHDRAVFHFLSGDVVGVYRDLLHRAVAPGGCVVMATFAPDGPEWCSGLPVTRYGADQLNETLGDEFKLVDHRREVHVTPSGATQPFTWIAARRISD
jgi:trans-aconitate methyltransferase